MAVSWWSTRSPSLTHATGGAPTCSRRCKSTTRRFVRRSARARQEQRARAAHGRARRLMARRSSATARLRLTWAGGGGRGWASSGARPPPMSTSTAAAPHVGHASARRARTIGPRAKRSPPKPRSGLRGSSLPRVRYGSRSRSGCWTWARAASSSGRPTASCALHSTCARRTRARSSATSSASRLGRAGRNEGAIQAVPAAPWPLALPRLGGSSLCRRPPSMRSSFPSSSRTYPSPSSAQPWWRRRASSSTAPLALSRACCCSSTRTPRWAAAPVVVKTQPKTSGCAR